MSVDAAQCFVQSVKHDKLDFRTVFRVKTYIELK